MWGSRGLLCAVLVIALSTVLTSRATAQEPSPEEAVATAVDLLEREGYVAAFTLTAEPTVHGEVRYESSDAYSLVIEDGTGAALEYILLDPYLYIRHRRDEDWDGWERLDWHPDVPVQDVGTLHPRLPLELLRLATDLRDASNQSARPAELRTIEGIVSYTAAFFASYEDTPVSPEQRDALLSTRWPMTVQLDPESGRPVHLLLEAETGIGMGATSGTLTYTFLDSEPPRLMPPPDAIDRDSMVVIRPAPDEAVRPLPLRSDGRGGTITTPPFRSDLGTIRIRLDADIDEFQYQIWRIKRGRMLVAALGVGLAGAQPIVLSLDLAPGEYVLEIQLSAAVAWMLTIEERPPREADEPPER